MPWYAAHAIMYFELTDGPQDQYQVYENVFLVHASTPDEAFEKGRTFARRDEGDSGGSLRVGNRPARLVFGGIRQLITVTHERADGQIGDGDEITYSEILAKDRGTLDKIIRGEDVEIHIRGGRQDQSV